MADPFNDILGFDRHHCILSRSKYEKSKALVAENRQSSELVSAELDHALSQVSREQQRYDMLQQYAEDTMQR